MYYEKLYYKLIKNQAELNYKINNSYIKNYYYLNWIEKVERIDSILKKIELKINRSELFAFENFI